MKKTRTNTAVLFGAAAMLAGCAGAPPPAPKGDPLLFLNRVTWGANATSVAELERLGTARWLDRQLKPPSGDDLPPDAAKQVAALTIVQREVTDLGQELFEKRRAYLAAPGMERQAGQRAFQQELTRLGREAASRSVLRALYSPWQVREHLTWFWMNHFSIFMFKAEGRLLVGDYEENAIRPHALGKFRELLGAATRHPAMLRYLDNAQNAANRLNENFARELMELHTLGVGGGYTQKDVQELARVLTGFGIMDRRTPLYDGIWREGLFEFRPGRHDYGQKTLLGERMRASGPAELEEALDRLARHPSTARHVSRKLAMFLVSDDPPPALVDQLTQTWAASDGDIAAVLRTLFSSAEFEAALGQKFKDPVHFVYSAIRLADDGTTIRDPLLVLGALGRMGQPLYARPTPDGYPLTRSEWASAGQLATRFEIARAIGYAGKTFPELPALGQATAKVLEAATSPQERTFLLLSSPEFMYR